MTRLTNNDSSNNPPPHGNLKRFSSTLLALAIATHATATPKPWQEPNLRTQTFRRIDAKLSGLITTMPCEIQDPHKNHTGNRPMS
jgi:hypothetical protein